jgi:phosphatidylserine decarboxylase
VNVGTYAFAQLLRVLPRTRITRAVGRLCDLGLPTPLSRLVVGAYVRAYDVDLEDCEPLNGQAAYATFDAFFTRPLRAGARPDCRDPEALVSPADGRLQAVGPVTDDGHIEVKGSAYRASELLISESEAERYRGGRYAVIYLSPRDYHRVHAPAAGRLTEVRSAPGELFPVNRVSELHIPGFLTRNRRVAICIDGAYGRVTIVMVAAMIVGRITVSGISARDVPFGRHPIDPPLELLRGDEIGVFHLGSTAIVFVEARAAALCERPLGTIRLGQSLSQEDRYG